MAQSFLVFDFGSDEELAQQARHKVDGWKQGFRLDKKLLLKFNRSEASEANEEADDEKEAQSEKKGGAKSRHKKPAETSAKENIQLIVRLDFSDHERLSHQRWLERIPTEVPFKDAQSKIIRQNDAEFAGTAERFDSLS
jgi:AAA15 family ATPase/GTPase